MSVYSQNKLSKKARNDAWFKLFNFVPDNARILDIGCSSGNLGAALKKDKKAYVAGIDIDEEDVAVAKKQLDAAYRVNIETEDFSHLGQYDIVIMADVIEHLVNPVAVLKKIKSNLKRDGFLLFSIPNMANATIRLKLLKGRFEYKDWGLLDKTHLHFYDKDEVQRVFDEAGYGVKEMDCTVREIPKNILDKELASIGLVASNEFYEHLLKPESVTYQFIGIAQPGLRTDFKPTTTSSLDSVSEEIQSLQLAHQKELKQKNNELQTIVKETDRLSKEVSRLDAELSGILNSKAWRLVKKAYQAKSLVNRRKK